jgi:hypothetical protein
MLLGVDKDDEDDYDENSRTKMFPKILKVCSVIRGTKAEPCDARCFVLS